LCQPAARRTGLRSVAGGMLPPCRGRRGSRLVAMMVFN
jgi:hypothetical protein